MTAARYLLHSTAGIALFAALALSSPPSHAQSTPAGVFGGPSGPGAPGGHGAAWRLITNAAYGFRLGVPPTGTLADPLGAWPWPQGECGTSLREIPADPFGNASGGMLVDNFVFVEVIDWPGSASEWLVAETVRAFHSAREWRGEAVERHLQTEQDRAQAAAEIDRLYSLRPVVTNADEALVPMPRPGAEWPGGLEGPNPKPLGGVLAVYRKGARLLVVRPLQNPGQLNACVAEPPAQLERIAASLTFVEAGSAP